jgi:3-oxoacyl-[acyl-carrier-protein] synthase II
VLGYCWERYFGRQATAEMRPFALDRFSAIPGEGAAFFLLQPAATAAAKYASLTELVMGRLSGSRPQLPPEEPLILGCEGDPRTGEIYRRQLPDTQPVACFTPLYGASPVAQGFDLAVAALALQRGTLFPSAAAGDDWKGQVISAQRECHRLSCLRFGYDDGYAAIRLLRERG